MGGHALVVGRERGKGNAGLWAVGSQSEEFNMNHSQCLPPTCQFLAFQLVHRGRLLPMRTPVVLCLCWACVVL